MSNYYTPSIEEFYIGFEYEQLLNNPNWTKLMKPRKDNWEWVKFTFNTSTSLSKIAHEIKGETVRVKLLDNEDLESLGFVESKNKNLGITEYVKFKQNWGFNDQTKYSVYQMNGVWNMVVTEQNSYDSPTAAFRINVKNKSELKKLMNMLQIN